ncbi:hypothetical protein KGF57_000402, partial [Candida theae]
MSPMESITQLCQELNLSVLVSVCQRGVEVETKTLSSLLTEYKQSQKQGTPDRYQHIVEMLKIALGSSMDGLGDDEVRTLVTIAKKCADILDLNKKPISVPMTPNLTKAVRSLCTTIHDYCNSKWDGGV